MRRSALWIILLCGVSRSAAATVGLATYNVDPSTVMVAGISSGAFMAVQLHVAFSGHIHGAAIFAGGPFACAQDSESTAVGACESGSGLSAQTYVNYTNAEADAGAIDNPALLATEPVYLFSGTDDTTVHQAVMDALQQYYQAFSVQSLTYDNDTAAAHGWISPDGPNACDSSYSPYINNCSIDPEQTFLTAFYGSLTAKNTGTLGGSYVQFDQTPFCPGGNCGNISLDSTGWAFVPQSCQGGAACKLVVALHGCLQYQGTIGEAFVQKSGINEWADTNGVVVLYPQTTTSSANPEGCWDWWGYTGASYALQSGAQMQAVLGMIEQVTGEKVVSGTSASSGTTGGIGTTTTTTGGSGTCASLATSCTSTTVCCPGSSCQFGLCLPGAGLTGGVSGGVTGASTTGTGASSDAGTSAGSASDSSGGSSGAGTSGTHSASASSTSASGASSAGSSSGARSASTGSPAVSPSASSGTTGASTSPQSGGCGCTPGSGEGSWAGLILLLGMAGLRRRFLRVAPKDS